MGGTITVPSSGVSCFTDPLSVNEVGQKETILVAPNPSNGVFNLQLPDVSGNTTVEIYNTAGQQIFQQTIATNELLIDLSAQKTSGVLLLKVTNNGQSYYSKIALK